MSRLINSKKTTFLASALVLLVGVLGCSTDSPTAPDQVPAPPPTTGDDAWDISVKVNPNQLVADTDNPSTVTARFESKADGSRPPNGTTVSFTTTLGEFGALGSEATSAVGTVTGGKATVLLFPGSVVAGGTVTAKLEGSMGRRDFTVVSQDTFITSVTPSSGPASGGTVVTIKGVNFRDNVRVSFDNKLATVNSVSSTQIVVVTPEITLVSTPCDDDGDSNQGLRTPDKVVAVAVEFADGGSETLSNAYTAQSPTGNQCVGD